MSSKETNTSKALKGMSSQTLVTIVLGVVEIVSFSIMSRLLTQEDFGYYAVITAITAIFASFSETGIGSAIVQQKSLDKCYINNAFTISLLFGGFISLLLLSLAGLLSHSFADDSMRVPLMLMSITLLLNCLSSVNLSIMHRRLQFLRIGSIRLVSLIITSVISIWLAFVGYGYYSILVKAILYSIITFLLSLFFCKTRFNIALDIHTFKKIFSFSGWLMASVVFRNLAHQVDRLLMPRLLSVASLGAYNRPKDFVGQISDKICGIFDSALFPVLSGIQDNRYALNSSFRRSMFIMNIFSLLLTFAFVINSNLIIRVFLGEQWLNLRDVFIIVSFLIIFNFDGRLADCYLRSLAMTKQQFFFRIFETCINLIGVLIGFRWGIHGVALSFVITNAISKFLKIFYVGLKLGITLSQTVGIIISSWRFSILLVPVIILEYLFLPPTIIWDVLLFVVFIIIVLFIFVFLPNFVGDLYKKEIHSRVLTIVYNKLHINHSSN